MTFTRLVFVVVFSAIVSGATLPTSKPEDVGFSAKRLEQIAPLVKRHVDAGDLSGAVTLVARKGKVVHLEAHGQMDLEAKKPMQTGTLFRMASMTKPITAVAVLMLMEEGKLILGDPVSKFIPEFANGKVAEWNQPTDPRGAGLRLVPVHREMTLQDLLTHTAGMTVAAEGPAGEHFARLKIAPGASLAERVKAWGAVPLNFQPGTEWQYTGGPGFDTLGRVVEIVSGMTLEEFFERRIFQPLGMRDTFFRVPAGRAAEVAASYDRVKGVADARGRRAGGAGVFRRRRRSGGQRLRLLHLQPDAPQRRAAERRAHPEPEERGADDRQRHRRSGPAQLHQPGARPEGIRLRARRPRAQELGPHGLAGQQGRLRLGRGERDRTSGWIRSSR